MSMALILLLGFLSGGSARDGERASLELQVPDQVTVSVDPDGNVVIGTPGSDDIRVEGETNRVDGGGGADIYRFGDRSGYVGLSAAVPGSSSLLAIDEPYALKDLRISYYAGAVIIELITKGADPEAEELANTVLIYGYNHGAPAVDRVSVGGETYTIDRIRELAR